MPYAELQINFTVLVKNASDSELVKIREHIAKKVGNLDFGFIQEDITSNVADLSIKRQR